jgi:hypothetical protein
VQARRIAVKLVIKNKEEFDALPEAVRALYVEKPAGTWVVEGVVPETELNELKTKVGEFRDNNLTMIHELEKLRPLGEKFKDIDPEEYKRLKAKAKELEDKGVKEGGDVQKIVEAAVKPLVERLDASEKAREEAQRRADQARFRELVSADATKVGVKPNMMRIVLRDAEDVFELKDGKLAPRSGVKHPSDPLKDMTLDAWLQSLEPDFITESVGGGAVGGRGNGGRPTGAKELVNPTPEEMGRHMDEIASGKMIVVRR